MSEGREVIGKDGKTVSVPLHQAAASWRENIEATHTTFGDI